MKQKAFFTDLDGTLLTDDKEITPGNRSAIDRALALGHKVIVTTGRPLDSAIQQAQRLGLTGEGCYVIAFNGAVIYDMGAQQVVFRQTVPLPLVRQVHEEAARRSIHIQTYDSTHVLVEPRCDDNEIRQYCRTIHTQFRVVPDMDAVTQEPPKMLLINYRSSEELESFRQWLLSWGAGQLDTFFSSPYLLEVVSAGMNKGNALVRLAELLGIPVEDTVSAGDSGNDLSMIQAAGVGVAMCNGTEEIRSAGDYITQRDNNHDAVEEIIEKFVL